MKNLLFAFFVSATLTLTGHSQGGGIAILDLDAVARELGVEDKVKLDLITMEQQLNSELQRTQATMQSQMNGVQQAAGENPSEEDQRKIISTGQQLNSDFNRLKNQAAQNIQQERARMIGEFRIRLEPVALMAAKKRGFDIVLTQSSPPVFAFDNKVDITEDTIKLAIEAGMKVDPPTRGETEPEAEKDEEPAEEAEKTEEESETPVAKPAE